MRKLFFLTLLFPLCFNAQLKLSNIYDLYIMEPFYVEDYLANGLGFKKIKYERTESSNDFEYYNGKNNFNEAIYVKVMSPLIDNYKNIVIVRSANENYIQELKSDSITSGYEYVGKKELKNEYFIHMYVKDNIIISISAQKNTSGFYEVNMLSKIK
ncbi:hypothetical protein [Flavobacterium sp. B17]|uniref:hypothetical protein n=1 Tax=Flavobacterium sp. B17 TaxID=95618 RepID=UPI0005B29596|nr:hypothetical protein [Flavobacterium sp. B17]